MKLVGQEQAFIDHWLELFYSTQLNLTLALTLGTMALLSSSLTTAIRLVALRLLAFALSLWTHAFLVGATTAHLFLWLRACTLVWCTNARFVLFFAAATHFSVFVFVCNYSFCVYDGFKSVIYLITCLNVGIMLFKRISPTFKYLR